MKELTLSAKLMEIMNVNNEMLPVAVEALSSEQEKFQLLSETAKKLMSAIAELHLPDSSYNPKDYYFDTFEDAYQSAKKSGENKNILFFMSHIYSDLTTQTYLDEEKITLYLIIIDSIRLNNIMSAELKSCLKSTITVKNSDDENASETVYGFFDENLKQTVIYSFMMMFVIMELTRGIALKLSSPSNEIAH